MGEVLASHNITTQVMNGYKIAHPFNDHRAS